jgi:hypothetical protein
VQKLAKEATLAMYDPRTPTDIVADEAWAKLKESKRTKATGAVKIRPRISLDNGDNSSTVVLWTRQGRRRKEKEQGK